MKSRLIVNPVAGSDEGPDYLTLINQRLREQFEDLDIVITIAQGDAIDAGERTAEDDYDTIFVAGGDGTLNEVLNGVGKVKGGFEKITFGLIPLGTGNDFATALGIPEDVDEAINILLNNDTIKTDIGLLNDRYFINVSAGGFIAEVSDAVNPQLKTIAGKLAYLIGGAQVIFDYEAVHASIHAVGSDGEIIKRDIPIEMFAVCNSRMVGGGRLIAPRANIDDGLLDVCVVEDMRVLDFLGLLTRVSDGDHLEDEKVSYFRARELNIKFDRLIKVNTDGEVLETDECRYKLLARSVQFLAGNAPYRVNKIKDE